MIGAVVIDNTVQTLIVILPEQVEEMQAALNAEIVDARPYGLAVGDLHTPAGWTRNIDGEQVLLQPLEQVQRDGYTIAVANAEQVALRADEAEGNLAAAADKGADEVIATITEEVSE